MPTDLLLAAFALILLVNAVLVAVSLQSMRRARGDGRATESGARPPAAHEVTPGSRPTARPSSGSPLSEEVARAVRARRSILGDPSGDRPGVAPADPTPVAPPAPARVRTRAGQDRPGTERAGPQRAESNHPRAASAARNPAPAAATGAASKGRRRKFSLPPLDDDHERVSRSIESFLTGGDATGPAPDPAGAPTPRTTAAEAAPTTVALVAVCDPSGDIGVAGAPEGGRSRPATAAIEAARSVVERTLRGAARGTDAVDIDADGRFSIVLTATGELAARAYLRRIRATVEPLLEASDEPLRLATATATVLDESLTAAFEVAERRLAAAIARSGDRTATAADAGANEDDDAEGEPEPRAAGV